MINLEILLGNMFYEHRCTCRTYSPKNGYERCSNMAQCANDWCGAH